MTTGNIPSNKTQARKATGNIKKTARVISNRLASTRFRMRKKIEIACLSEQVDELKSQNNELKTDNRCLREQIRLLEELDLSQGGQQHDQTFSSLPVVTVPGFNPYDRKVVSTSYPSLLKVPLSINGSSAIVHPSGNVARVMKAAFIPPTNQAPKSTDVAFFGSLLTTVAGPRYTQNAP